MQLAGGHWLDGSRLPKTVVLHSFWMSQHQPDPVQLVAELKGARGARGAKGTLFGQMGLPIFT